MTFLRPLKDFIIARWLYLVLAIVALALAAWYFSDGIASRATMTVMPGDFPITVQISGTVVAAQDVDLGFAANGRVSGVYAGVGQHVAAGAVLAEVENGDLAAAEKQAEANLASLEAGTRPEQIAVDAAAVAGGEAALRDAIASAYTAADSAIHTTADQAFRNPRTSPEIFVTVTNATLKSAAENERLALESMLVSWKAALASLAPDTAAGLAPAASANLAETASFLADLGAALAQAVPDANASAATIAADASAIATARTSVNSAATALSAAAAALDAAEKTLVLAEAGPTQADLDAAEAAVENARAAYAKTLVVAPFSGTVTRMDAKAGEIVSPTDSQISMQSDGVFEIETYIPEVSIAGVAAGDAATSTLDAYGAAAFAAKVISVDPAETVKDGVPTYKTKLVFLAPDPRIRSGMTANVTIMTGILPDAIVIPQGAVGTNGGQPYVTVSAGDNAANRPVTLGATPVLGQVEITSGLAAGDVILLAPAAP